MRIGLGYRQPLAEFILRRPAGVECLEVTADHFFSSRQEPCLAELRRSFKLFVHGLGMSLGTPGPLDPEQLAAFRRVVSLASPEWVSEHVAFTRTREVDLGHLNPVPLTRSNLQILVDHSRELQDICQRPLLLENITSHLRVGGELSETEFLNQLCDRAHCRLLLDVTNLLINSRNHGFDPLAWLHELKPELIVQLHLVGYSQEGGRYVDDHSTAVQEEVLDLTREVLAYAPVQALTLERDDCFPADAEMALELDKLRGLASSTRGQGATEGVNSR